MLFTENKKNVLKVLHVCTDFWPSSGGIEKFVLELASASRKYDIEPAVLCLNRIKNQKQKLPRLACLNEINIYRNPFLNLKYYKPSLLPLSVIEDCSLLHVHGIGALLDYLVLTSPIHKKPIIVSTHGGIHHTKNLSSVKRIYFDCIEKQVLKHVDLVAACSNSDLALFNEITDKGQLVLNAVNLDRFANAVIDNKKANRFIYVGRLAPNKRVDLLIQVFAELYRRNPDFELHIVGSDPDNKLGEYMKLVQQHNLSDRIIFKVDVTDQELALEYESARFFVSASEYEGFGLTSIEAMAAGCVPILNTNTAFTSLYGRIDEIYLSDYSNSVETAKILESAMANNKTESDFYQSLAISYSWDARINDWIEIYSKVYAQKVA